MFIKSIVKTNQVSGERKIHFRLCESYRCGNTVKHLTIVHLGLLEELPEATQKKALGLRIAQLIEQGRNKELFTTVCPSSVIEQLAQKYYSQIKENQRIDVEAGKDVHFVDLNTVKNKQIRSAGSEWLCLQALEQLKVSDFFKTQGWDSDKIQLALTHIVSRATYPASELRTSQWIRQNSSVCELSGYAQEKINKDRLYEISHQLYSVKEELEKYLSKRTNELFDLNDSILLFDLTNTYYEGVMRGSKIAKFGRSKEKRSDARLVVLALVVNEQGFVKYSNLFEGNTADSKTLEHMLENMSSHSSASGRKPIVVLDAGIATEDNIKLLKAKDYDYICVSRSKMKNYTVNADSTPIKIADKKNQPITLQKVSVEGCTDNFLHVLSEAKGLKEASMNSRFSQQFEQGLTMIKESIAKKGGVKKETKVSERIGNTNTVNKLVLNVDNYFFIIIGLKYNRLSLYS